MTEHKEERIPIVGMRKKIYKNFRKTVDKEGQACYYSKAVSENGL